VVAQGAGYTGGIINTDVCVAPGCYEFTIYDEYGDGLCCDWGTGSYSVISATGETLAEGATFTDLETSSVCTNTVEVNSISPEKLLIYPNPANDFIQIQSAQSVLEVMVFDATGRLVLSQANLGMKPTMNIEQLVGGVYELHVKTANGSAHQTIIVNR
jgi:hypothetical protein